MPLGPLVLFFQRTRAHAPGSSALVGVAAIRSGALRRPILLYQARNPVSAWTRQSGAPARVWGQPLGGGQR